MTRECTGKGLMSFLCGALLLAMLTAGLALGYLRRWGILW